MKCDSLDNILREAVSIGATDIHLSVGAPPRVRINGVIKSLKYDVVTPRDMEKLIYGGLRSLDTYARTILKTEGQYDLAYDLMGVARFRVNIFMQKRDLAGVFRVLPNKIIPFDKLGLPLSIFSLRKKRRGLILVVGPTGSGKTTTLASFISLINNEEYKHIVTLEDPIEYLHWHGRSIINQREIGSDCDSFKSGLRSSLREDIDVILVGEMRDYETVEIAVRAAETGHLVCSTLHTLGVSETINRIVDIYPSEQQIQVRNQLASLLEAVISQQLLPKKDGSGYTVAYEIMYRDSFITDCIRANRIYDIDEYLSTDTAVKEGMCSMDNTILERYIDGLITRDTAIDYAFNSKTMREWIDS